jgi:hypothetical protein
MDWVLWCVLVVIGGVGCGVGVFVIRCLNKGLDGFDDIGSSETDVEG